MMRAAIIDNGTVANIIEVDTAADCPGCILCGDGVGLGWTWDGISFSLPAPLPETSEQTQARLTGAVQNHLDAEARRRGYDSIISACSYAGAPNRFQAEAASLLAWRAAVWAHCFGVLADCQAGGRDIPSAAELISELPYAPGAEEASSV